MRYIGRMIRSILAAVLLSFVCAPTAFAGKRPRDIVDVKTVIPDLVVEMRYLTPRNFVGVPIDGYRAEKCLLTRRAAEALKRVADDLRPKGYVLKVYDCYRPQRAVNQFVRWGRDIKDQKMKPEFYPNVDKRRLFNSGYIARRSGHSRASTVDLTIIPANAPEPPVPADAQILACDPIWSQRLPDASVDMGTGFDCFSTRSHTRTKSVTPTQRTNRMLLYKAMRKNGFKNNPSEWWHYTLRNEPYPRTYFDFPVE